MTSSKERLKFRWPTRGVSHDSEHVSARLVHPSNRRPFSAVVVDMVTLGTAARTSSFPVVSSSLCILFSMHCKALSVSFVLHPDFGRGTMHWCRCKWHWNLQTVCLQVTTPSRRKALTMSDVDAPFSRSTLMRCLLLLTNTGEAAWLLMGRRRRLPRSS